MVPRMGRIYVRKEKKYDGGLRYGIL